MSDEMKIFRFHFHPDAPYEALHGSVVHLIMLLHELGVWPKTLHPTARSKKEAIKKSLDLTMREDVESIMSKVIQEIHRPNFLSKGYWSEAEYPEDRFVISFFSNPVAFRWPNMLFVEISDRKYAKMLDTIESLSKKITTPFIVCDLGSKGDRQVRISTGDGLWMSEECEPIEFSRLIGAIQIESH